MVARVLLVPIGRHTYDGHEAEHLSWFLGERAPGAGDTLAYPLMQWWWWLWGLLLPADERLPLVISVAVGALGACALAALVGAVAGRRAGLLAGALVALHPTHVAWSSSAYNVILPHTLGYTAVAFVVLSERWRSDALRWAAVGAGILAVSGRIETIVYALPCALLALGTPSRTRWFLPAVVGAVVGVGATLPVAGAGPLPGAEERWQSLWINLPLTVFHAPLDSVWVLAAFAVLAVLAARRERLGTLAVLLLAAACHVLMSSFDDYGGRHTLPALVAAAWCVGVGGSAGPRWRLLPLGAVAVALGVGVWDLYPRFYGSEEAYVAKLSEEPWAALPRLAEPPGRAEGCGWIAEDERVADVPPRSHFNLLSAAEVAGLRGADGCLHWCVDVQDWRWSSRGVRSRAQRLDRMYILHPVAVMEHASGYSCLVMRVGERSKRAWPVAPGWHGRGHSADSFLP